MVTNRVLTRMDPTRTATLRRVFGADMKRRYAAVRRALVELVVDDDAFGLSPRAPVTFHQVPKNAYAFATDARKVEFFRGWLQEQVDANLLTTVGGEAGKPWTAKYVESSYRKGRMRAYVDSQKSGLLKKRVPGFGEVTREEFLRSTFLQPEALRKIELVATRAFEELRGVSAAMSQTLSRDLAEGLANGWHPQKVARKMTESLGKNFRTRAQLIARTETIRAHAEGQLDTFEQLGVERLGAQVEWATAGDPCEQCLTMEGQTFTVQEARGYIPLHPNCRCAWVPYVEPDKAALESPAGDLRKLVYADVDRGTATSVRALYEKYGRQKSVKYWMASDDAAALKEVRRLVPAETPFKDPAVRRWLQELRAGTRGGDTMKIGRNYINPALRRAGVKQKDINALGDYLSGLYQRAGLRPTLGPKAGPVPVPKVKPKPKLPEPKKVEVKAPEPPAPRAGQATKYETAEDYRRALVEAIEQKQLSTQTDEFLELAARRDHLKKQMADLRVKRNALAEHGEKWKHVYDEEVAVQRQVWKLNDRINDYKNAAKVTVDEQRALLREVDSLKGYFNKGRFGEYDDVADEVMSWMPKSAKQRLDWDFDNVNVVQQTGTRRLGGGWYQDATATIKVFGRGKSTHKTFAHEFGHHVSYKKKGVMRAQTQLYKARTAGEREVSFGRYNVGEVVGKKDRWSTYDVYAGRRYADGRTPEVFSVGLEHVWANPYRAATKDPEWFNMIVSQLKGIPAKAGEKAPAAVGRVAAKKAAKAAVSRARPLEAAVKVKDPVAKAKAGLAKAKLNLKTVKAQLADPKSKVQRIDLTFAEAKVRAQQAKLDKLLAGKPKSTKPKPTKTKPKLKSKAEPTFRSDVKPSASQAEWEKSLSSVEKKHLRAYAGPRYHDYTDALRRYLNNETANFTRSDWSNLKSAQTILKAIERSPGFKGPVHRGMAWTADQDSSIGLDRFLSRLQKGRTVSFDGLQSFSADLDTAHLYANWGSSWGTPGVPKRLWKDGRRLTLHVDRVPKKRGAFIERFSPSGEDEAEVLLGVGGKWRVTKRALKSYGKNNQEVEVWLEAVT